jgi:asparagine synthase (glutamine-hydrolysing)
MCGISGIISKSNAPIDQERIERINDLIHHRGPDDVGYYFGRNFVFGHRRLSIIDLSARGHQPMCYLNRYWITYNGEIYNYLEIREELLKKGYSFNSDSDTEVILAAYAAYGPDCLKKFNGMWAFAIYDAIDDVIFMARDRFGVKPFYYQDGAQEFVFGSEIKQLLALQTCVRANQEVVIESLLTHFEGHTEDTFFKDVKCLPQGHYIIYNLATHSRYMYQYYQLEINERISGLSYDDAIEGFKSLFKDAVRLRLRSDVVVGTCLSGGLDSSAISSVAAHLYRAATGNVFTGIHAKSTERQTDESEFARKVAQYLSIDLLVVEPSIEDFINTIDEVVYTQEEPFGSPSMFMGWHVFNKAKTHNCTVMLNGQGGDEILLGYERYYSAFLKALPPTRFLREIYWQSKNSKLNLANLLMYYFYFTNSNLRIQRLKLRSLLRPEVKDAHDFSYVKRSAENFRNIDTLQIYEICTLQLPHLLRYEDRNSMRHSIETRLPFLDYRLVEFGVSIIPELKIKDGWTKYILRKTVEDLLPKGITWRKTKLGFQAPEETWFTAYEVGMKKEIAGSFILSEIANKKKLLDSFHKLPSWEKWNYFNMAAWERVYKVNWA